MKTREYMIVKENDLIEVVQDIDRCLLVEAREKLPIGVTDL